QEAEAISQPADQDAPGSIGQMGNQQSLRHQGKAHGEARGQPRPSQRLPGAGQFVTALTANGLVNYIGANGLTFFNLFHLPPGSNGTFTFDRLHLVCLLRFVLLVGHGGVSTTFGCLLKLAVCVRLSGGSRHGRGGPCKQTRCCHGAAMPARQCPRSRRRCGAYSSKCWGKPAGGCRWAQAGACACHWGIRTANLKMDAYWPTVNGSCAPGMPTGASWHEANCCSAAGMRRRIYPPPINC